MQSKDKHFKAKLFHALYFQLYNRKCTTNGGSLDHVLMSPIPLLKGKLEGQVYVNHSAIPSQFHQK